MTNEEHTPAWRRARPADDDAIQAMFLALNREDPGSSAVEGATVLRSLAVFRAEPHRGAAVVVDVGGAVRGYALLVPYWSNELGGCVLQVDELFVEEGLRSRGIGSALFRALDAGQLVDEPFVALAVGVSDGNHRARALYERLGFRAIGTSLIRSSMERGERE